MKKIAIASLLVLSSSFVFAADKQLVQDPTGATKLVILAPDAVTNNATNFVMKKSADDKGFVKNDFNFTVSANVAMTVADSGRAFGVITGSPKGRNVYTGLSEGGSIKECGDQTDAKTPATNNLGRFIMTEDNACGEAPAAGGGTQS